jgi:hypothetical protein
LGVPTGTGVEFQAVFAVILAMETGASQSTEADNKRPRLAVDEGRRKKLKHHLRELSKPGLYLAPNLLLHKLGPIFNFFRVLQIRGGSGPKDS